MKIDNTQRVFHTLEPWFDSRSRILILGTMPSVKSREYGCYYGHPQNRFWPTLARVFGERVPLSVDERRTFCSEHGIALWDVLASCDIRGSMDASIQAPTPNDMTVIFSKASINAVLTTGKTSKKLYDAFLLPQTHIEAIALPSTSPANRRWFSEEQLVQAYSVLLDCL